jgi:hypothetical protein
MRYRRGRFVRPFIKHCRCASALTRCGFNHFKWESRYMVKKLARVACMILMLAPISWAAGAMEAPALPQAFAKLVPRELRDGLQLVEVKTRCADCPPWRTVDIVPGDPSGHIRQEKVSVRDGVTAMYAYPGTVFFANAKMEVSAPGSYERDKAIVIEAIEHACARSRQGIATYLQAHPDAKDKYDRAAAGRNYVDSERGSYKGYEYVWCSQNAGFANPTAMLSQVHIFLPQQETIVTAYLMKQKTAQFRTIGEFLQRQRDFIEAYIDFLAVD